MNELSKIVGLNLVILLAYTAAVKFIIKEQSGIAMSLALIIICHFFSALASGLPLGKAENRTKSMAYILSAFLVLLIGFSLCTALI